MKITKKELIKLIKENLGDSEFENLIQKKVKEIKNTALKSIGSFKIDYKKMKVPEYYRQYLLEKLIESLEKEV